MGYGSIICILLFWYSTLVKSWSDELTVKSEK